MKTLFETNYLKRDSIPIQEQRQIILRANNINLQRNQKILCHHLSLTVNKGSVIGILGANGCGKTTLLHTLAGLDKTINGSIYLNEKNINDWSPRELARVRGILFQESHTALPVSVREYCLTSRYPHQTFSGRFTANDFTIVHQALIEMDLLHLSDQSTNTLSGGEKKRLALASLIIQNPSLFFLDEPTNHLDVKYQLLTLNYFKKLVTINQATVIMSLHDVNMAQQYCDYLILMYSDGAVLQGKTMEILTSVNLTRLYECSMQPVKLVDSIWWQASL